jgi:hypothetical protein
VVALQKSKNQERELGDLRSQVGDMLSTTGSNLELLTSRVSVAEGLLALNNEQLRQEILQVRAF